MRERPLRDLLVEESLGRVRPRPLHHFWMGAGAGWGRPAGSARLPQEDSMSTEPIISSSWYNQKIGAIFKDLCTYINKRKHQNQISQEFCDDLEQLVNGY